MVALPIGIVATAFADEIHRRDFVVTWGMVARVPLFGELQATDIADIVRLLRAQRVEAGDVIAKRGEPAHSMYFVAAGEVEIELNHERVRLGAGHFFRQDPAPRPPPTAPPPPPPPRPHPLLPHTPPITPIPPTRT